MRVVFEPSLGMDMGWIGHPQPLFWLWSIHPPINCGGGRSTLGLLEVFRSPHLDASHLSFCFFNFLLFLSWVFLSWVKNGSGKIWVQF
jgi:hypothetical protein